ncbi:hypothetical protein FEAC_19190 [Ferrimicrobium acidiphilum DSM 19497]|uniref:Uncharacterized protein n=1 Tax=Ferrimicrobium acidiphilum DSM 19497 TaxID=1121877 RepID=A0A0D8FTQ3_9ACTN|nr:hypothetical protein FEAC_19190 [Ferrimicrobium acidiphilum DSM 19497]
MCKDDFASEFIDSYHDQLTTAELPAILDFGQIVRHNSPYRTTLQEEVS